MPYLDDSIWQEVAKWFAGIAVTLATLFLGAVRWWAGDRFREMSDRLDSHEDRLDDHDTQLGEHHETVQIVLVHIENGKTERLRIERNLKEARDETRESFKTINAKLDRIVESK